jgi:3-hydroxyisobutyrate dehydrogenase-like beta-hydroxyacid dehydrogenase
MGAAVGLLHPGAMGAAIGAQIVAAGTRVVWCPYGRSPATRKRAEAAGLVPIAAEELFAASDVIVSLVPPAAAEDTAAAAADHGFTGVYVEANAIRPERYYAIAERLAAAGATVVDACVLGPPPPGAQPTRLYLSGGDACDRVAALVPDTVEVVALEGPAGRASALKIAQSVAQKVTRVQAILAHALASHYGVTEELTAATASWPHPAAGPDRFPGIAARAWRWAPELADAAAALREAGLPDQPVTAAAALLDAWEPLRGTDTDTDTVLAALIDPARPPSPPAAPG